MVSLSAKPTASAWRSKRGNSSSRASGELLFPESEQPLPPRHFIAIALYRENVLALATAPGLELLVVIRLGTAAMRAGSPHPPCRLFIHVFPV